MNEATKAAMIRMGGKRATEQELESYLAAGIAEADRDVKRMDFIESHPNWLRQHRRMWCCVSPSTSYEYSVFKTAREAIDAAIEGRSQ
jgi:hypothetical protein